MTDDEPVTQGQALRETFQSLKLGTAARRMGINRMYLWDVTEGHRPLSPRAALLVAQHFPGRTAEDWLAMGRNPEKALSKLADIRKAA